MSKIKHWPGEGSNPEAPGASAEHCKKCAKCEIEKPIICFGKSSRSKDGHQTYCKNCRSQMMKELRNRRGDEINKRRREKRMSKSPKWKELVEITKQRDELIAERDTWKARYEFSIHERDKLGRRNQELIDSYGVVCQEIKAEQRLSFREQRDELQLIVTNQRQQIAHLNDDLAGTKSNVEFFKKQRDEIQVKANAMAETITAIAGLCTYQHESKEDFIGRVRAVLGDDPDLRVSSVRKDRDELLAAMRLVNPSLDFTGWESADGEPIGEQINAAIASVKGGAA